MQTRFLLLNPANVTHSIYFQIAVDALDKKYMKIGPSQFQEGSFARRKIPKGILFSLYGGLILTKEDMKQLKEKIGAQLKITGQYTTDELSAMRERFLMYR